MRFLSANKQKAEIAYMLQQNLERLGYERREVVSIKGSESTVAAIRLLVARGAVTKIAVVDDNGNLTGSFSPKLFRSVDSSGLTSICLSVDDFLAAHSSPEEKELFTVSLGDTKFGDLLDDFSARGVHHAWVVEEGKPVGIITLTDVMRAVLHFRQTEEEKKAVVAQGKKTAHPNTGILSIRVDRCKSLVKGSWTGAVPDSFVTVKVPGGILHQTQVVPNNANPEFLFPVDYRITEDDLDSVIVFEVWGRSAFFPNSFLGSYTLSLRWVLNGFGTYTPLSTFKEDFTLQGVPNGEITLNLSYVPSQ